ncbi:glycoside hydrolase family 3 protein [Streptomyces fuscigenes]|uniref:glycoside hydrolase family 3 protein n=1 Tax=Streptomyces fuscigenes TaxID=1528880 RepID=UPI001F434BE3|nr:glycoside hydrolase family 3 N-terminal domain-containing protein [Streptomyces fuscigenes]MCF3963211.1 glycoside hydrolase family 3 protein [Streptomyces fuscigenes]
MTAAATGLTGAGTLERDALAVLQPGFAGTEAPDWVLRRLDEGLASVALFGRNVESPAQLARLTAQLRADHPGLLIAVDEEGGDVTRIEVGQGSSVPGNYALGTVDDTALTRDVAASLGRALAACGIDLDWAPSVDVNSNPDNPVIGVRSFGSDPELVARHSAAYVEGLQSAGVAASAKHFPGHGDTAVDSHHALPRIDVGLDTLRSRDLLPFRAAVAAGAKAVMSAHIISPALDPDRPATLSGRILTGLLREELGFEGLIITDGMDMDAIAATYGTEHGTALAIAAGADAICVGGGPFDEGTVLRLRDAIVAAVREGELPEERLADAAARVRALADWTQRARAARPGAPEQEGSASGDPVGLVAARRALRVTGTAEALTGPAYVAVLGGAANIAVGTRTPWGVGPELARLLPGTESDTYTEDTYAPGAVLGASAGRPLVIAVRDVHRHPWTARALDQLTAERPGTTVVEMGLDVAPPRGALHIATHGAARVCAQAAAEVIAGRR